MKGFGWIALLGLIAAAPTTKPTTNPTGIDLRPLIHEVDLARKDLASAKEEAMRKWEASTECRDLKAVVVEKRALLEKARENGTPKEKLDASAAYNQARSKFETSEAKATATPEADANLSKSLGKLHEAEREIERAVKRQEENSPIAKAIRDQKLIKGMTKADTRKVFRYTVETIQRDDREILELQDDSQLPRRATCVFVNGKLVSWEIRQ